MNPPRMRPRIDSFNKPFWSGGADGKLRIHKCGDCNQFVHPPLPVCRHCQSENVGPEVVPGTGKVDTYTVNHQPWYPGVEVPYVIARVRIDGAPGVILTTNIINCPVESVAPEDKVRVVFEEQDGIFFPLFEKAD